MVSETFLKRRGEEEVVEVKKEVNEEVEVLWSRGLALVEAVSVAIEKCSSLGDFSPLSNFV